MSGYHGFRFGEKTEPISLYQDKQRGFAGGFGVKNPPTKASFPELTVSGLEEQK